MRLGARGTATRALTAPGWRADYRLLICHRLVRADGYGEYEASCCSWSTTRADTNRPTLNALAANAARSPLNGCPGAVPSPTALTTKKPSSPSAAPPRPRPCRRASQPPRPRRTTASRPGRATHRAFPVSLSEDSMDPKALASSAATSSAFSRSKRCSCSMTRFRVTKKAPRAAATRTNRTASGTRRDADGRRDSAGVLRTDCLQPRVRTTTGVAPREARVQTTSPTHIGLRTGGLDRISGSCRLSAETSPTLGSPFRCGRPARRSGSNGYSVRSHRWFPQGCRRICRSSGSSKLTSPAGVDKWMSTWAGPVSSSWTIRRPTSDYLSGLFDPSGWRWPYSPTPVEVADSFTSSHRTSSWWTSICLIWMASKSCRLIRGLQLERRIPSRGHAHRRHHSRRQASSVESGRDRLLDQARRHHRSGAPGGESAANSGPPSAAPAAG